MFGSRAFVVSVLALSGVIIASGCRGSELSEKPAVKDPVIAPDGSEVAPLHGTPPGSRNICMEAQRRRVPIIMYHDMMEERTKESLWYDCSVEEFRAQMEAIEIEGFTVISMQQLYDHLTEGKAIPEKSIVLTFDDNYQSFYDLAWPILKEYDYPATMYVHTAFVGVKEGRPKMDWSTLKELLADKNFTIGAHTVNHYLDLKDRPISEQREELEASKLQIQENLGVDTPWLAYPNGSNSEDTQFLAESIGFKLAVTIENTPAEESPNIFAVGRYVHTKFNDALIARQDALHGAPADIARFQWNKNVVARLKHGTYDGIDLAMVIGGRPSTAMSPNGREPVQAFIERESKGVAGINGGFFAMAAIASNDNQMVGPLKTPSDMELIPDNARERWPKINNRPLVMWSEDEFAILPYIPSQMLLHDQYEYFMANYTDCFMAGVWLVHKGQPQISEFQNVFGASDIQDPRRRAFIGITKEGEFVAGASTEGATSERLAWAIALAGVEEAVLLDSGFSTSLVYNGKIEASGHSSKSSPSRPVPHAIVISGEVDPESKNSPDAVSATTVAKDEDAPARPRRKRTRSRR